MNSDTVLFEGTVMFAYESDITDTPSEVVYLNYPLEPINIINVKHNEKTGEVEEQPDGVNDKGLIQIRLPVFHGLNPGDKIKVVKCS